MAYFEPDKRNCTCISWQCTRKNCGFYLFFSNRLSLLTQLAPWRFAFGANRNRAAYCRKLGNNCEIEVDNRVFRGSVGGAVQALANQASMAALSGCRTKKSSMPIILITVRMR